MLKIRRPLGRLIFNMGIAIPGKTVFLIETAPWKSTFAVLNRDNSLCIPQQVNKKACEHRLTPMKMAWKRYPHSPKQKTDALFENIFSVMISIMNKIIRNITSVIQMMINYQC